jgi:hypothetical protein
MTRGVVNRDKENALSLERVKSLLDYDPATGVFRWRVARYGSPPGKVAGTVRKNNEYIVIWIDGSLFMAHRLAWFYATGEWPYPYIDHANCDRKDNRFENLRVATRAQNTMNTKNRNRSSSGVRGVYWSHQNNKWIAYITINSIFSYLGQFDDLDEATRVRAHAERKCYGEFARA